MSDYRESSNAAKAVRRGIVQPRPVGGRRRLVCKADQVVIEMRSREGHILWNKDRNWGKWASYPSQKAADQALPNLNRKYHWSEFRIKP